VVEVRWNEPQDTGFDVGGQVSEIQSYSRVLLECSSEGTNTLVHIPPSQCASVKGSRVCTGIISGTQLQAAIVYYVRVISQNDMWMFERRCFTSTDIDINKYFLQSCRRHNC